MAADEVADAATGEQVDDTVEALRAVARAAVDVGRQLLDALERAIDDPATADKVAEVVAGFGRLADSMRSRPVDAAATGEASDGGLERIELT